MFAAIAGAGPLVGPVLAAQFGYLPGTIWIVFGVVLAGGRDRCSTDFSYSGPLTESVILGNVAARFPGETLEFDGRALAFPKKPEADQYLRRAYRRGWALKA